MESLELGRVVKSILLQDKELSKQVGSRVFPLVADKGTSFPFIVYRRDGLTPSSNKDRLVYDTQVRMSFIVASSDYRQGLDICSKVVDVLLASQGRTIGGLEITDLELLDTSEEYREDTFLQLLSITVNIKNK
nr:MAG TPA: PORTAL PROTEIN, 15 PROTEIN, HEAD PROTEIN, VIRAL INFECTION, TAILED.2A [Caudoviricetes sp.]